MAEIDKITYLSNEAASVKSPYFILGICLLLVTVAFYFVKFPEIKDDADEKKVSFDSFLKVFHYRHLSWAIVAQFFYVGAQVCVTSFFIRVAIKGGGIDEKTAGYYLGIYGLLFMIGRFAGTFFMRFIKPQRLLTIYSAICLILSIFSITLEGKFVVYALGGLGFFMSIMFPTIFSLGIKNLGADTKSGASLIVMGIVGGAFFPYLMGWIIDFYGDDIQKGYYVPFVCFFFVLYFGISGHKVKEKFINLNP
jgi:FHS family L-fucose permease-like MFS transporter